MKRRLFTALSVLSLVACLAVLGLCARSYTVGDNAGMIGWRAYRVIVSAGGAIRFTSFTQILNEAVEFRYASVSPEPIPWTSSQGFYFQRLGIGYSVQRDVVNGCANPNGPQVRAVLLPHWMIAALAALLPALWAVRLVREN